MSEGPTILVSGSMSMMMRPTEELDFKRTLELEAGETESRWSISESDAPARPLGEEGDGARSVDWDLVPRTVKTGSRLR